MASKPKATAAEVQKKADAELAQKWLKEIDRRRSKEKTWRDRARKVIERYRDDRGDSPDTVAKYNILWANTEVLKPAIFNHMPVPDVRRRYLTRDPAARTAALILERALSYSMDQYDFKDVLDRALEDYLLPGRGQVLVCYKPTIEKQRKAVPPLPDDGEQKYDKDVLFDGEGPYKMQEEVIYEEVYCDYVEWDLYVFGECKTYSKVPWEAVGEYLAKDDIRAEFPKFGDVDELTYNAVEQKYGDDKPIHRCLIWRVWHKASRKYLVFAEGYKTAPLDVVEDPLQLQQFYPLPEPLYSVRNNKDWTPIPEYYMYQDQASELDRITNRLKNLIEACKNRGVYDQAMDKVAKISDLMKAPDNTMKPIPNFAQLADKGGIEALISTLPLEQIATTIIQLRERKMELVQEIYEIMGISDIVRGSSNANETLGAQQLKAQYSGMRVSTRQERFQRFIRDILRMKAEIMAEHFLPETLKLMTGIQTVPDATYQEMKANEQLPAGVIPDSEFLQACQIIKSDKLRGFKVDIETDSTIPVDKQADQENRVAFMGAIGQYLQGVLPAVQSGMIPAKIAREGLLFVVRGFKVGSELEEVLDELGDSGNEAEQVAQLKQTLATTQQQMQEQGQQAQEQIGKLTEQNQQLQSKAGVEQARAQAKAETDQFSAQVQAKLDTQTAAHDALLKDQEARQDRTLQVLQAKLDMAIEAQQAEQKERLAERDAVRKDRETAAKQGTPKEDKSAAATDELRGHLKTLSDAMTAMAEHSAKPVKRSGMAKLPDGRMIALDVSETRQ